MKYLLVLRGGIEPELNGPYKTEKLRSNAARDFRTDDGRDVDVIVKIDCPTCPQIETYSGGFFEET